MPVKDIISIGTSQIGRSKIIIITDNNLDILFHLIHHIVLFK